MALRRERARANAGRTWGGVRAGDRKPEHGIQEERGGGDCGDREHDRDQDRAAQHVKRLAVQCMCLPVEHDDPDPHRGHDLDEREPPIREQQLEPVEERHDPAGHERKRSEQAPRATQSKDRLLDHRLVAVPHGAHVAPEPRRQRHLGRECGVSDSAVRTLDLRSTAETAHRRPTILACSSSSRAAPQRRAGSAAQCLLGFSSDDGSDDLETGENENDNRKREPPSRG